MGQCLVKKKNTEADTKQGKRVITEIMENRNGFEWGKRQDYSPILSVGRKRKREYVCVRVNCMVK